MSAVWGHTTRLKLIQSRKTPNNSRGIEGVPNQLYLIDAEHENPYQFRETGKPTVRKANVERA